MKIPWLLRISGRGRLQIGRNLSMRGADWYAAKEHFTKLKQSSQKHVRKCWRWRQRWSVTSCYMRMAWVRSKRGTWSSKGKRRGWLRHRARWKMSIRQLRTPWSQARKASSISKLHWGISSSSTSEKKPKLLSYSRKLTDSRLLWLRKMKEQQRQHTLWSKLILERSSSTLELERFQNREDWSKEWATTSLQAIRSDRARCPAIGHQGPTSIHPHPTSSRRWTKIHPLRLVRSSKITASQRLSGLRRVVSSTTNLWSWKFQAQAWGVQGCRWRTSSKKK